jgi:hypothetical protein
LHIETGGSMAGCIEDLFTQYLWDFDRLKGLNCSPMEERFQDFVQWGTSMLPLQHRRVANATYKRNAGATIRSILRYSENDSGPEVGFGETLPSFGGSTKSNFTAPSEGPNEISR